MASLLLDTHAVIWISAEQSLSRAALDAVQEAYELNHSIFVSPITAWEIGLLVARGRLKLNSRPDAWFNRLLQAPEMILAAMTPDVLIAASFLPDAEGLRDPADRILAATAREYDYRLVTRDRHLLDYAVEGYLQAIEC